MKKSLFILIFTLITSSIFAQNQILNEKDIPKLNSIIKSLEDNVYKKNKTSVFESLPQTTANYFKIITNNPNEFLNSLSETENFEQLIKENPGIQIDRDLLIIKNVGFNYKKEKIIEIKSFEIGNSQNHLIEISYNDSLNNNNIKFLYSIHKETWSKYKDASIIQGFYLNNNFNSVLIPEKYTLYRYIGQTRDEIIFRKRKIINRWI